MLTASARHVLAGGAIVLALLFVGIPLTIIGQPSHSPLQAQVPTPTPTPSCGWGVLCDEQHGTDTTKLSTLDVDYELFDGTFPVSPVVNGLTKYTITLIYRAEWDADCEECEWMQNHRDPPEAVIAIAWRGAVGGWNLATSSADPEFLNISLCATDVCVGVGESNGTGYKILVEVPENITDQCPGSGSVTWWLTEVFYKTFEVPQGNKLESCIRTTLLNPNTQVYSAGDNGDWECTGSCPFGPSRRITY